MPRVVSFVVLLAIVLLVGAVFFRVMAQFLVPLFLACVLLVMFQPLHAWMLRRLPKHPRVGALLTTVLILLVVLLPIGWLSWKAYDEFLVLVVAADEQPAQQAGDVPAPVPPDAQEPEEKEEEVASQLTERLTKLVGDAQDEIGIPAAWKLSDANVETLIGKATGYAGTAALNIVQGVLGVLVGLFIMVIALYYFLADGPAMIRGLMKLSPLDDRHELELLARFGEISRAVVVATLLSAVAQGLLAGVGYYFALPSAAPIFLLTALTMVMAIVPFIGAAGMWVPVCIWIYLYIPRVVDGEVLQDGNPVRAVILAVFCAVVVSGSDNVIKPWVLHGQSNLHPLLALLSILGGVTVLGPVGILVGPMLVSFLQALLNMLHKELEGLAAEKDANTDKRGAK